ncbi:hypothetical protein NUKP104_21200 [Klebsiella variicola]|nr:hypothetical protein NUKP104_21200 [Klebsiella variicola]
MTTQDYNYQNATTPMGASVFVRHYAVTTEVVVAYSNSNIDLTYIAYALHDSPA